MKSVKSLRRSASACLNRAIKNSATLNTLLTQQRTEFEESRMARIRGYAEHVARDVHEYNAYNNTLTTE
jgi:hypothetical protein